MVGKIIFRSREILPDSEDEDMRMQVLVNMMPQINKLLQMRFQLFTLKCC